MIKQLNKSYCCLGLMSGTSLDGLDMVLCNLNINNGKWSYSFVKTQTVGYSKVWRDRLRGAISLDGYELIKLHREYGFWLGGQVKMFLNDVKEKPCFIASHGHTVFHEPSKRFNFQLGDGAAVAAEAGITTISDFRSLDICLGGQGAPLVPVGDELLFGQYSACVNLGGFANVSCRIDDRRVAWDICAMNFILNRLVKIIGKEYDDCGLMGEKGRIVSRMMKELEEISYYKQVFPKSLGQEWTENVLWPIITKYLDEPLEDVLRTYYEHVAVVIANDLSCVSDGEVLFTGGGVHNSFLMELITKRLCLGVVIPERSLVDYKEALIFALLGALRWDEEVNCLSPVTGAKKNSSSGVINII